MVRITTPLSRRLDNVPRVVNLHGRPAFSDTRATVTSAVMPVRLLAVVADVTVSRMRAPPVQYVPIGDEHVAFQVVGDGPVPALSLTSWIAPIDGGWEDPEHLRMWRAVYSAGGRAVHLDHRGLGSSDPVPQERLGDLDEWVDDVVAVLDAIDVERVSMMAELEQAAVAIRLATRHPERVERIAFTYPLLRLPPSATEMVPMVLQEWGTGRCLQALGLTGDLDFLARSERRAASRASAAAVLRAIGRWDVSPDVERVQAECLVMSILSDPALEHSAELATRLPRGRLVEVSPTGLYWGDQMFEQILEWVGWSRATGERRLSTLVLTDIVGSTSRLSADGDSAWRRTLDFLDDVVTDRTERHGGEVLKHTGDGHLLAFDRPGEAVSAALAISDGAARLGVEVRAGVHAGEIEQRDNLEVSGMTVHVVARISAEAAGGEVLISRTVKDLLGGSPYVTEARAERTLKGVPSTWQVFLVRNA